jgi:hypothetical protein
MMTQLPLLHIIVPAISIHVRPIIGTIQAAAAAAVATITTNVVTTAANTSRRAIARTTLIKIKITRRIDPTTATATKGAAPTLPPEPRFRSRLVGPTPCPPHPALLHQHVLYSTFNSIAICRQALLHSRATVIQRYFRGFITRLRTVDAIRQLQVPLLALVCS